MDFFEVLKKRRAVRSFSAKKIGKEKLSKILLACASAPSAGNMQAYKIFVAKTPQEIEKIRLACGQDFLSEAQAILVFFADKAESTGKYGKRGEELYCVQDASIACAYGQLAATTLGLASCWVGSFDENEIKRACGKQFQENFLLPIALLPLGYAKQPPHFVSARKKLSEIVVEG